MPELELEPVRMPEQNINEAVRILRAGGVVALPTETVYGLAADITNDAAVARIFTIKNRPADHPLIVHLPLGADFERYAAAEVPSLRRLAQRFWPGPLTIIVPKTNLVSDIVTGGQSTVALRVVDHPITQAVLERFAGAVAAPSANRFGHISPTTAQHVRDGIGADVDLIIDGGPARIGIESTIVDLSGDVPAILRAGVIGVNELEAALGRAVIRRQDGAVRAPGMLASHYAPRSPLKLVEAEDLSAEVAWRTERGERVGVLRLPTEAVAAARALYAMLHLLDASGYDVLLATLPPDSDANAAVRDRLVKAAAPRPE